MGSRSAVIVLVVASACGAPPQRTCATRGGTFRETFEARSGNCGAATEIIGTDPLGDRAAVAGGSSTGGASADSLNCKISYDMTCPFSDGGTIRRNGAVNWNFAGTDGTGSEQVEIHGPNGTCLGTYDVTIVQL